MDILDIIFPKTCFGCGKKGTYLCAACLAKENLEMQICPICFKASISGKTHPSCRRPLGLDGLFPLWGYKRGVRKAILTMKYRFAFDIAGELSSHAAESLGSGFNPFPKKALLVPIPVYKDRKNWRGFNQAEEVGKRLASLMKWDFNPKLLIKGKKTVAQTGLTKEQRRLNLSGAFILKEKHLPLSGLIILFDDVWTTGSTLKEACSVLKQKGVKKVWGLTLCRG